MKVKNLTHRGVLFILFLFILLTRLPVTYSFYCSVDEGVSHVMGNTILNGGIVYKDAIDHRGPVTYFLYAFVALFFGKNNIFVIHLALLVLILAIVVVLYRTACLMGHRKIGYWAIFLFAVFSYAFCDIASLTFETEWPVVLFSSLGSYFLLLFFLKERFILLFLSGLAFGLSFFSKQPAFLDFMAALLFCGVFVHKYKPGKANLMKAFLAMVAGFSLVAGMFVCYFASNHAFHDFWFYFWTYNVKYYVPAVPLSVRILRAFASPFYLNGFFPQVVLLVIFFLTGCFMSVFNFIHNSKKMDKSLLFHFYLMAWGLCSYAGASASGRYFPYYYLTLLPPFCLMGASALYHLFNAMDFSLKFDCKEQGAALINNIYAKMFLMTFITVSIIFPFFCSINAHHNTKMYYAPRSDFLSLTEYIKNNTEPNDKIFVWGWCPDIYIYTGRDPASRYIYCNFLTGFIPFANADPDVDTSDKIIPGSWDIFMREMEKNRPKYIVDTSVWDHKITPFYIPSPNIHRYYQKYPPSRFSQLSLFLANKYVVDKDFFSEEGEPSFRVYKRKT